MHKFFVVEIEKGRWNAGAIGESTNYFDCAKVFDNEKSAKRVAKKIAEVYGLKNVRTVYFWSSLFPSVEVKSQPTNNAWTERNGRYRSEIVDLKC